MANVRSMATFITVVTAGSFTAAAIKLGVTPAAVSKSIQNLERELGIRLLNRSTRRQALTEEGELLFERCQSAMLELDNAVSAVVESRRSPMGTLRVTSAVTYGRCHLLPLLAEFMASYPKVTVDLTLEDHFVDTLVEGYDVSIRADIPPMDNNLVAKRIMPVPAVVCGAPSYFERHPVPRTPAELLNHNCVRFRSVGNKRILEWEFQKGGQTFLQGVSGTLILNDSEGIRDAVAAGLGLGQIPGFVAAPLIETRQLKPVLLDYLSQSRAIYICYSTRKYMTPKMRTFIDFLAEKMKNTAVLAMPKV